MALSPDAAPFSSCSVGTDDAPESAQRRRRKSEAEILEAHNQKFAKADARPIKTFQEWSCSLREREQKLLASAPSRKRARERLDERDALEAKVADKDAQADEAREEEEKDGSDPESDASKTVDANGQPLTHKRWYRIIRDACDASPKCASGAIYCAVDPKGKSIHWTEDRVPQSLMQYVIKNDRSTRDRRAARHLYARIVKWRQECKASYQEMLATSIPRGTEADKGRGGVEGECKEEEEAKEKRTLGSGPDSEKHFGQDSGQDSGQDDTDSTARQALFTPSSYIVAGSDRARAIAEALKVFRSKLTTDIRYCYAKLMRTVFDEYSHAVIRSPSQMRPLLKQRDDKERLHGMYHAAYSKFLGFKLMEVAFPNTSS